MIKLSGFFYFFLAFQKFELNAKLYVNIFHEFYIYYDKVFFYIVFK